MRKNEVDKTKMAAILVKSSQVNMFYAFFT